MKKFKGARIFVKCNITHLLEIFLPENLFYQKLTNLRYFLKEDQKYLNDMKIWVLGQLPPKKIAPNAFSNATRKRNPNPNREALFLGGNCPDTENSVNMCLMKGR